MSRPMGGESLAAALMKQAEVDLAAGRPAPARAPLEEALHTGGRPPSMHPLVRTSFSLARAHLLAGDLPRARAALDEAAAARGDRAVLDKDIEHWRAALSLAEERPDEAERHARAAIAGQKQ